MTLDKDDVAQDVKSPECVKLQFNCLQNLEIETKTIREISLAAKEWKIKGNKQLNEMNSAITFIIEKIAEFENEIKNYNKEIKSLRKENSYLTKRLEEMDAVLDRYEQYSRPNCLLTHEVDELEGEGTVNYL